MDIFDLEFVRIAEEDDGEVYELPVENNGNLALATLQGKFPHALGLIFENNEDWVVVKKSGKYLQPPQDGWGKDKVYLVSLKGYKTPGKDSEKIKEKQDNIFQLFLKLSGLIDGENYNHSSVIGAQDKVIQVFQEQLNSLRVEQTIDGSKPNYFVVTEADDKESTSIFKPQNINKPCKLFQKGYCHFGSKCNYLHALTSDRKRINENPIDQSSSSKRAKNENKEKEDEIHDLFVYVLPSDVTEEQVKNYFTSTCGKLESCKLRKNPKTGSSRRVADIRFETIEAERAALTGRHIMKGKHVTVDARAVKTLRIKVKGIPPLTSEQDLKIYFSKFGDIHQAFISDGQEKVGYVHLKVLSKNDLNALNQNIHLINGNKVSISTVSKAEFKDPTVQKVEMKSNTNTNIQGKVEMKSNTNTNIQGKEEMKSNTNTNIQENGQIKSNTNITQQRNLYPVKGSRDGGRIERLNQEIDRLSQEISVRDHKYKGSNEGESSQGTSQWGPWVHTSANFKKDRRDLRDENDFKSRGQHNGQNPDDSITYNSPRDYQERSYMDNGRLSSNPGHDRKWPSYNNKDSHETVVPEQSNVTQMDYRERSYMDNGRHSTNPGHDKKWPSYQDKDSHETIVPEQSSAVTQLKSVIYSLLKNPK